MDEEKNKIKYCKANHFAETQTGNHRIMNTISNHYIVRANFRIINNMGEFVTYISRTRMYHVQLCDKKFKTQCSTHWITDARYESLRPFSFVLAKVLPVTVAPLRKRLPFNFLDKLSIFKQTLKSQSKQIWSIGVCNIHYTRDIIL
jgi:hypothetical protein